MASYELNYSFTMNHAEEGTGYSGDIRPPIGCGTYQFAAQEDDQKQCNPYERTKNTIAYEERKESTTTDEISLGKTALLIGTKRTLAAPQPSSNNTSPTPPEAVLTDGPERVAATPSCSRSARSPTPGTIREAKNNLDEQRAAAIADLHGPYTVDGGCLKELYTKGAASERRIQNVLAASALYDFRNGTWVVLPQHMQAGQLRDR
ncbi:hypothetical protein DFP72DRAFT_1078431 [Ephemerocybe angulata]|uniref:Uncharacterized protein n=1 Tax=Ephemerocybe angulata TaxID=980116 RepID=A0A8H6LXB1_9AGAR|nr:hypothetical protein DFP72DRAFT_1078431 [Tulosesus angulatus]